MIERAVVILAAVALVASALLLVTAQHRARSLFVDLERAQLDSRQLDVDFERLKIDLARLTQPALVERAALKMGFQSVESARTVYLNLPQATAAAPVSPGKK